MFALFISIVFISIGLMITHSLVGKNTKEVRFYKADWKDAEAIYLSKTNDHLEIAKKYAYIIGLVFTYIVKIIFIVLVIVGVAIKVISLFK